MTLPMLPNDAWDDFREARERLRQAHSREDVIECVRAMGRTVIGSDGVTFVLREGALCHYVEEDAIAPLWKGRRFPIENCISGWTMLNAEAAVIEDIRTDPRIPQDAYQPTFVRSLIMTPVITDRPVAAIGAYWRTRRHFSPVDIRIARSVSEAVGRALAACL